MVSEVQIAKPARPEIEKAIKPNQQATKKPEFARPPYVVPINAGEKVAILIAGTNYPKGGQSWDPKKNRPYALRCERYSAHLLTHGTVTKVVTFDVATGKTIIDTPGNKQTLTPRDPLDPNCFKFWAGGTSPTLMGKAPPDRKRQYWAGSSAVATALSLAASGDVPLANYDAHLAAGTIKDNTFSINDVYLAIRHASPGTVAELHFFGHSFGHGPIILNSTWRKGKDKYDKDGRTIDFATSGRFSATFGNGGIDHFKKAFTEKPLVMIWGCAAETKAKTLYNNAENAKPADFKLAIARLLHYVNSGYAATLSTAISPSSRSVPVLAGLPIASGTHEPEDQDVVTFTPHLMHINMQLGKRFMKFWASKTNVVFATTGINKGDATFGRGYAEHPITVRSQFQPSQPFTEAELNGE